MTVRRGFTLIEMLVVLAVLAMLLSLALPKYFGGLERARETLLVENLQHTRTALDQFYADQGRYPDSLDELVSRRYLRALPIDPLTNSTRSWRLVPPEPPTPGRVADLRSGARGKGPSGLAYATR
ncbi:type II secretion system protein [Piscinibacter gummiphilus]|uniref:Type II secretion system protein G n=1 Tax=Piscinibacter gummiphilus TaxID=946333 RepID=A0A1W6LGK0_9BURK|nr:prepilin-type N-terminal cleavage/methylation domain-containing protein [Piscinibacter gummiphilus]ARN23336.1 type II secretion system protein G [Piscinibacter gummiphilus]ATU68765.1 prepilin-type N-terminal cleavage/methylation domain-containing protein [Piscinibacter gummiphilus]GLS97335.1 type II secretion system pseudopilin OxpG [Piscinibacter gummiphilus]